MKRRGGGFWCEDECKAAGRKDRKQNVFAMRALVKIMIQKKSQGYRAIGQERNESEDFFT